MNSHTARGDHRRISLRRKDTLFLHYFPVCAPREGDVIDVSGDICRRGAIAPAFEVAVVQLRPGIIPCHAVRIPHAAARDIDVTVVWPLSAHEVLQSLEGTVPAEAQLLELGVIDVGPVHI